MFSTVFGLPAHPLVVHAAVVLVPLAAAGGLLVAMWPAARARYAPLALGIATLAMITIPLATQTGEQLEENVRPSTLVERHAHMAEGLLPFMAVLWLSLAVLVGVRWYGAAARARWTSYIGVGAAAVTIAASVGSAVQVVRIGHSGSEAAWHGVATSSTRGGGPNH
ncbi:MAG TPA: DUF2231 domain-containing protein [Streptosporangiaceae bacterium]|nr:DUF2231 domain-containing protein [Streptosporangiaceae bacterium]